MNIRKSIDYSTLYAELDKVLSENLPQMEEIHAIGRAICKRQEKGAAVAVAEFLQTNYPEHSGFPPRNVRRIRDFYRTYENDEALLRLALNIGWTLNVIIMEADLTRAERKWYLEQAWIQHWTKMQLVEKLKNHSCVDSENVEINMEESSNGYNRLTSAKTQNMQEKAVRLCWLLERSVIKYNETERKGGQHNGIYSDAQEFACPSYGTGRGDRLCSKGSHYFATGTPAAWNLKTARDLTLCLRVWKK